MKNFLFKPSTTGGIKSFDLEEYPKEAWTWLTGGPDANSQTGMLSKVDWLYRAVNLVMSSTSEIPFYILNEKGKEVDKSSDWQNIVGFWPNPFRTIQLTAGGLFSYGYAYLLREKGGGVIDQSLRYMLPGSVTPVVDPKLGLQHFERPVGGVPKHYEPKKEIVYFWLPDAAVEVGPPNAWPAKAAFSAAAVLYNLDVFVAQYFARGAIKATVLSIPPTTREPEAEKIKLWWSQFMRGVRNAFGAHILTSEVTATIIGEGLEALSDRNLTDQARQAISTASGIPQSLLSANAANYATAQQDKKNLYDNNLNGLAKFIGDTLNEQVLKELGYHLEFRPEEMELYQENETERAQAFKTYVDAGIKLSIAAEMLGLDLPRGVKYKDLDPEEKKPGPVPPGLVPFTSQAPAGQQPGTPAAQPGVQPGAPGVQPPAKFDPQLGRELSIWQSKCLSAVGRGEKASGVSFVPVAIPLDVYAAICARLEGVEDAEGVRKAFVTALHPEAEPALPWGDPALQLIAQELKRANDLLETASAG